LYFKSDKIKQNEYFQVHMEFILYSNRILFIVLITSLFFSAAATAVDRSEFKPIDPLRRSYSTANFYQSSVQSLIQDKTGTLDNAHSTLKSAFVDGRQLVDNVIVSLNKDVSKDSILKNIRLTLNDDGKDIYIDGTINADGNLEFDAGGRYASSISMVLPKSLASTDPIDDIQVQSISLSGGTRIMLIGDSITHGKFADDFIGYRHMLYDRLDGDGAAIDFVGDYGVPPYEGHFQGGEKINDFYPRNLSAYATGDMDVTNPMNQNRPSIVAIHLGTNDLNGDGGLAVAPYGEGSNFYDTQAGEMATLVNYLLKWHNGDFGTELEHILVSLVIPIKYRDSLCVSMNLEIARLVNNFRNGVITGQPEPVELVDHFSRFREWPGLTDNYYKALMYDSLHPNNAGHDLMADTYYDMFTRLLSGQQKWFTDITWTADLMGRDIAYNGDFAVFENQGIAVADFDNDGIDDIYASRTNSDNPHAHDFLYQKSQGLPYTDVTDIYDVADPGGSRGIVFVDIDNDGDFDLFNGASGARNRLYRNDSSQFTDISNSAGIVDLARVTTGVTAADIDADGDLDLYAVNSREKNKLYINNGYGKFSLSDRGADDQIEPNTPSLSVSAADIDNDDDIDFYIVKRGAANVLFINDGSGHFNENASGAGIALESNSNGATWADLDNDGDLDLLVAATAADGQTSLLNAFENNSGIFTNRTSMLNIETSGYSPIAADFDNDGDMDILATQENDYAYFYRNDGSWDFTQRNDTGAEIHGGDIRGATVFDYDTDGDLDLFAARADMFNVLLQNNLESSNNFLNITAEGPQGDRGGFGTKIWLYEQGHTNDSSFLMSYSQVLSANGHVSQSSPTQHFGLGAQTSCDILVRFIDGSFMVKRDVSSNQTVHVSPAQGGITGDPALISMYDGDQQSGIVGDDLANPLVVKITDDQGRAVSDIDVAFEVTSGDAQLFLPEMSGEKISLQPETGQLSGGLQRISDETASGGAFVMNINNSSVEGSSILQKEIPTEGDFYLWLRVANSGASQNINIKIDDETIQSLALPTTNSWQWILVDPQAVALSAGMHNFELTFSSRTIHVDKLLLLLNSNYTPSGFEDSESQSTASDGSGLANRHVKLGESAGFVTVEASSIFDGEPIPGGPIQFNLTANPGLAALIQKTSGDNQSGQPGVALADPFVITVFDALNNPVPNVSTNFSILSGGGALTTEANILTDSQGRAQTTLIPGESSSIQHVQVHVANISGSPVVFQASISGVASEMKYISGNNQNGLVKSILPVPIKVQMLADDSQPAANFAVNLSTQDDGALLSRDTLFSNADSTINVTTDAQGFAQIWWQLGKYSGEQKVRINAGNLTGSPLTLSADAAPSHPAYLLHVSGDGQIGHIEKELSQPFAVKLLDAYGNGTPGHNITFSAQGSYGSFNGATLLTLAVDSTGGAATNFTFGTTAGENISVATATATLNNEAISGSPINFLATILPGSAALSEKVSGDNQSGTVDSDLDQPFVVRVTDAFQNPVSGKIITFEIIQGNGSLNRSARIDVPTNANGNASAIYHVGATVGEHRIRAMCSGVAPTEHEFVVQALSGAPFSIENISGNDQQGAINAPLPAPFVVRVSDRFGNAVPAGQVDWSVTSPQGSIDGQRNTSTPTNNAGEAQSTLTLGAVIGDSLYSVEAQSSYDGAPLTNSPIQFIASAGVGAPTSLIAISPTQNLFGAANYELPEPIRVKVTDDSGLPIANFQVDFQILAGGGEFAENGGSNLNAITDASGIAQARWTLGGLGLTQQMRCFAIRDNEHLQNSPLFFNATTVESQPQKLIAISGDGQTGAENTVLRDPFVVKVVDEFNAPYSGQAVIFSLIEGDGIFIESNDNSCLSTTTADGFASVHLKLGSTVGENAYSINIQSFNNSGLALQGSPITIHASGTAQRLRIVSGDNQTEVVNSLLPDALKIQLTDERGAGISGLGIVFSKTLGEGDFTSITTPTTNDNGIARVQFKLGQKSGNVTIKAAVPEIGAEILFHLTAIPDNPAALKLSSGNGQTGVAGHRLNQEVSVTVVDQYNNGVSGVKTLFSPQSGHGTILPSQEIESDSTGNALGYWVLGPSPGEQILFVSSDEFTSMPLHITATALPNQAPHIVLADSFFVNENEMLSFTVDASDAENDSVSLHIENLPTDAAFNAETKKFSWTPHFDQSGVYPVIFQAIDAIGARRIKMTTISVQNTNRTPVISLEESQPREHQLGRVEMQSSIDFSVVATDPDGDHLNYIWKVNDQPISTSDQFRLQAQLLSPGTATVEVLVFDYSDTSKMSWSLEIITAIKLAFFKADFEAYMGVALAWKTRYEWGNLGFYIQRAARKDGPFEIISPFLESEIKGEYQFTDEKTEPGVTYFYRLQDVQTDGARHEHETIKMKPPMPENFALHQNYPNPFNPATIIRFDIAKKSNISLTVFDLIGRQVNSIFDSELAPGFHSATWNGKNDTGESVASGVYYATLVTPKGRFVQKMLLLR
jgi:enediyne biosynthesis protein E4